MIYLMRHGLDDERYVGGFSDVSLIDEGIEQVKNNRIKLTSLNIKRIISSDIKRARETTGIVNEILGLPIEYDKRFRELDKGLLTGMEVMKAKEEYPEFFDDVKITDKYPQEEAMIDLYKRVIDIIPYLSTLNDTLIVTHRGVINMLYYILEEVELDMNKKRFNVDHASIHELDLKVKKIRRIY